MTKTTANLNDKNPLYLTIKEYVQNNISSGKWAVNERIPSEKELSDLFQTSRMTVNKALRDLASEGAVIRRKGQGSFVAPTKVQSALLEITSIEQEILKSGGEYTCNVHLLCEEKASPQIALQLELTPYESVYHSIIINEKDGLAIELADRFINPVIAPGYLKQDFTKITPTDFLLKIAPVRKVEHVVEAIIPPAWIRSLLSINEAEPCLALSRRTWSKGVVATKSSFYYPGSRYRLGGIFSTSNNHGVIKVA